MPHKYMFPYGTDYYYVDCGYLPKVVVIIVPGLGGIKLPTPESVPAEPRMHTN